MDQRLKDQALEYDLESLRNSLSKHDENIESLVEAVEFQEIKIAEEQGMIDVINRPDATANPKLIEIDTMRLRDSISGHHSEIDLFKEEIKNEEGRRRETEQMVMYLEALG